MGLADYTAIVEAGNAVVDLLRDNLTPEPLGNRELIALCSGLLPGRGCVEERQARRARRGQGRSVGRHQLP